MTIGASPAARLIPPARSFMVRVLWLSLLVFAALALVHRSLLFVEPWHEYSDYAVDALKIERARHFGVIHGNYSRFDFYHPGPAFYYVYALGEQVFFRWLALVPSPYNAHALSGLILQCFFFGAALIMADHWVRRPLFIPLALLMFTIHLALAGNAFIDTWPPRVLLMPFLCFLIGVASVAGGWIRHLPLTVLAGCFLVHGHVAMPLYVLPLSLLAYGIAWSRARDQAGGWRAWYRDNRVAHAVSAGCIALFLVPIVMDLAAGTRSNLAQILAFETIGHGPGKPLWKALVYFCEYFGYVKKTEMFLSVWGPGRATAIGEHLTGYFAWAAIISVVLFYVRRLWRNRAAAERPFVLSLAGFTILAFLLSLYWGMVQIGAMHEYCGYFYYAITGGILLLLSAASSALAVPRPTLVGALLGVVTAGLVWQRQYAPPGIDYSTNLIPPAVRRALAADPLPAAPKYLLFNRNDWGEAVMIGLALQRAGREFRADADWGPKFTPGGDFEPGPPGFDMEGMSTWRLLRRGPPDAGRPLRSDLRVYFQPLPLELPRAVINCDESGNLELYTLFGFSSPLGSAAWTIRPYAGLVFDASTVSSDLAVTFLAEPYAGAGGLANQPMTLSVNGREVFTGTLTKRGSVTARVPADVWNARKPVLMVMHFPAAVSPRSLGRSLDQRMFGWQIERVSFEPVR